VEHRGEIVSRRDIMDAVWPNVAVEQNNLTVQLTALRRLLDVDRKQGSCIENITGRGYRFVPTVTDEWPRPLDHGGPRGYPGTQPRPGSSGTEIELPAAAGADSGERRRLSLVVLPFSNLGGDGVDDAMVDAITEDLTSDLGRVWGLFVISRGSALAY